MKQHQSTPLKKAIVVSHERSGTHFLMNTLALNFGYIAKPWLNFDFQLGINFYHFPTVQKYFESVYPKPVKHIMKSHHPSVFFSDFMQYLADTFHVFYIYRDPRDVMLSFWEFISKIPWDEGPKVSSVSDFMRAAPRGAMLRYQKEQMPTLLHRWKNHVEGWSSAAEQFQGIFCLRYEDLHLNFDNTVKKIGKKIGIEVENSLRPPVNENVVMVGKGKIGRHRNFFHSKDYDFIRSTVGKTMTRLGYE